MSALVLVLLLGVYLGYNGSFPTNHLRDAKTTLQVLFDEFTRDETGRGVTAFVKFTDASPEQAASQRLQLYDGSETTTENFLIFGGLWQFMDLCPTNGCIAVEITGEGEVVHAYPYFPEEIHAANIVGDSFPHEYVSFDPRLDMQPVGMERASNGDLFVVFQRSLDSNIFPFGTGIARINRDGKALWYRFDYSHHWPSPINEPELLVPTVDVGDKSVAFKLANGQLRELKCESGRPLLDGIQVLDRDGNVVGEYSVLRAVLESPFRSVLWHSIDPCDPLHLNYVDVIRDDVSLDLIDVEPGDLVISMREVSAFGILDREDGRLKRLVRGTFIAQHSVQHLSGSCFLMFDNAYYSSDEDGGAPSRLLLIDIVRGTERAVFPMAKHTPEQRAMFSSWGGHVSISSDRRRAVIASTTHGRAFEVRLEDGHVLREFASIHNVSSVEALPQDRTRRAAIFQTYGINFVETRQ